MPAGDDYFLLFLNISHGHTYCISDRFAILPAGGAASGAPTAAPTATTVVVSGAPDPTAQFATTFPAVASAARPLGPGARPLAALGAVAAIALAAGAWAVL